MNEQNDENRHTVLSNTDIIIIIMSEKIKGVVKWFSNRKGFGFITPNDNDQYTEDLFVHVTAIIIEPGRYRTLKDGFETEFEVITDENGKYKAVNVTSADGSPCPGSELRQRSRRSKKTADENNSGDVEQVTNDNDAANEVDKEGTTAAPKRMTRNQRRSKKRNSDNNNKKDIKKPHPWEQDLEENVQVAMKSKDIEVDGGRAFLSIGDARMKLGTDGYAALAHSEAILAEGKWTVVPSGIVSVTWERVLNLVDNEWTLSNIVDVAGFLLNEVDLSDDLVQPTGVDETTAHLWGEGKTDPKEALETNGFLMRRMILNAAQAGRGRRRGRRSTNQTIGSQSEE